MSQSIPEKYRDLFSKRAFASLGTLMPDGSPQVTPVWCDLEGDHVVFNSAKGRQKDRNIRRDPRIALLRALTEVIQDANHDNGVKAWVICPGFVDTDMGYVIPGANPASFLKVDEVVDVVRFLLHTGDNVKLGPEILVRTMRNPMTS